MAFPLLFSLLPLWPPPTNAQQGDDDIRQNCLFVYLLLSPQRIYFTPALTRTMLQHSHPYMLLCVALLGKLDLYFNETTLILSQDFWLKFASHSHIFVDSPPVTLLLDRHSLPWAVANLCAWIQLNQDAVICKWNVFTENSLTKCSWAHVVISFIQSSVEPCPIFACDQLSPSRTPLSLTCYQRTCLPVKCSTQVFVEHFNLLYAPVPTCVKCVHGIKFRISKYKNHVYEIKH